MSPCVSFSVPQENRLFYSQRDLLMEAMDNVQDVLNEHQNYSLYVPVISWYNPYMYDGINIKKVFQHARGIGFGFSYWNEKRNWNSLYIITFQDRANTWEQMGGYAWEYTVYPCTSNKNFHIGMGYTTGISSKFKNNNTPTLFFIPLASIGYEPIVFQMTYTPGFFNSNNHYYAWLRFQF